MCAPSLDCGQLAEAALLKQADSPYCSSSLTPSGLRGGGDAGARTPQSLVVFQFCCILALHLHLGEQGIRGPETQPPAEDGWTLGPCCLEEMTRPMKRENEQ